MRAEFNYTNEEKSKIIDFKNRVKIICGQYSDEVIFVYGFVPIETDLNTGYLLYRHFIRALTGNHKVIDTEIIAEGVDIN